MVPVLPVQCCEFSGRWVKLVCLSYPLPDAMKTENSELSDSKARARFAPRNSKIERACFLMTLGTSQGRATVAPISSLEYIELIVALE